MDDYILMPDDKTMERLAHEYSKVRAKSFSNAKVEVQFARKKYKIKRKEFNPTEAQPELDKLTCLYLDGIALMRKLSKYIDDEGTRDKLFALSLSKRDSLETLSKCKIYGQNVIKCCSLAKILGYPTARRAIIENALDTVTLLSHLREKASHTDARATFNRLLEREYLNCLSLTLLLS